MMYFLTINDFKGEVNLDISSDVNVIAQFETLALEHEKDILRDLLGDSLYDNLINDLSGGVPQSTEYYQLVYGTSYYDNSGQKIIYDGLQRMLKYFVYCHALENGVTYNTSVGQMSGVNENSVSIDAHDLIKVMKPKYNKAVNLYNKAIKFINTKYATYFTGNEYSFWVPVKKQYIGVIKTGTPCNYHFMYKSSKGN